MNGTDREGNEDGVVVRELETAWPDSHGSPLALFTSANPAVEAGSYVIEPGEPVPAEGTTSHSGPELSVILSGDLILGVPHRDQELRVGSETFTVIPAGLEHYSANRGDRPGELVYVVAGEI